jgi:hypothetical protein
MNIKDIPIGSVCIFDAVGKYDNDIEIENRLGLRVEDGFGVRGEDSPFWADEHWNFTVKRVLAPSVELLARCAVIDPDDDEQVEALYDASATSRDLRDHLRALAALSVIKPDEPQGLGAVVLDPDTGRRWVRADDSYVPWWNADGVWCCWDEFPATVQVLSEGLVA